MKKILSLVLAAMMLLSCTAFAENLLEADPEEVMSFNRKAPITDWKANGSWLLLTSAKISLRKTTLRPQASSLSLKKLLPCP